MSSDIGGWHWLRTRLSFGEGVVLCGAYNSLQQRHQRQQPLFETDLKILRGASKLEEKCVERI